ncbi:MAG: hypothetical protein PHV13_00625 [Candidatus ainarchaeum sp.]|nr:hypothetical protein [Candidatus ainarchaeum sp.]
MTAELFITKNKVPTAELWHIINGIRGKEPLCDTLKPDGKVVDALSMQGLGYRGLGTKFLQPLGNTVVHLVPYHEGLPGVIPGFERAECGAHENGWYAAVNIRTPDKDPDPGLISYLENATGVGVSGAGGRHGRVLVTLSCIVAAETSIYTVSLIDTELLKLRTGMATVNRVASELLKSRGAEQEKTALAGALG